jgi:hypothetical protein
MDEDPSLFQSSLAILESAADILRRVRDLFLLVANGEAITRAKAAALAQYMDAARLAVAQRLAANKLLDGAATPPRVM